MDARPRIETRRLVLAPFTEDLLTERYVGWLNDLEVVRFSDQRHRRHTLESCTGYLASFAGSADMFYAAIARDPALGHVGNLTVSVDPIHRVADISILVGEKRLWGKGYGAEAFGAMTRHLLTAGGMRKVTAGTLATHAGMIEVARRAGMKEEARWPRHHLWEGQEVDTILFAAFAEPLSPTEA